MAYLQFVAAGLAFIAAIFWFLSGAVKLPEEITTGWGGTGGTAQKLGEALVKQSKFSKYAALSAGAASICEGLFLALTTTA